MEVKSTINEFVFRSKLFFDMVGNKYVIYLQPKHRASDGVVTGAEALMRKVERNGQITSASNFVPEVEAWGYDGLFDEIAFKSTLECLRHLKEKVGVKKLPTISFNVSTMAITNKMNARNNLYKMLSKETEYCQYIELEITESLLTSNSKDIETLIEFARKHNYKVSIDDFGNGLSSLSRLKEIDFDCIKLDNNFSIKWANTNKDKAIIDCVMSLSKALNKQIVIEGVETEDQVKYLQKHSDALIQGFYFSKPMSVDDFINKYNKDFQ